MVFKEEDHSSPVSRSSIVIEEHEASNAVGLDEIRARVIERAQEEAARVAADSAKKEPKTANGGPEDPRFVLACLENNERGDGVLFATLHRSRFLCNKATGLWFKWAGHHWVSDKMNEALAAVENVALAYQTLDAWLAQELGGLEEKKVAAEDRDRTCAQSEDDAGARAAKSEVNQLVSAIARASYHRKEIGRRVDRLRSEIGAKRVLFWAHNIENPLAIIGEEIDKRPLLLPCANGVIDLDTGALRPADPADLLVRAIPIDYRGIDHPNEDWERFIDEIHQSNAEVVAFVRRLLGYCLTGLTTEHFIGCFIGEGANGKGTLFEVLRVILGELAWAIEPEMLLEQKYAKSSAGPSPDVISLHGRRLIIASETDQNRRISAAKVKKYTGGDTLVGRSPHDKYEINFEPTHKLVLYTNHPPKGLAADFALFRRLIYLWYPLRFVDDVASHQKRDPQNAHLYRPRNAALKARLLADPAGILGWLVRGCLEWKKFGLNPPASILAAADAIRRDEDHLERFIDSECSRCEADRWVPFKSLYEAYARWFAENVDEEKRHLASKKAIGDQIRRKGYLMDTIGGNARVYGLDVHRREG